MSNPSTWFPAPLVSADHVEPVPRRIRAVLGGKVVVDTTSALYVWEWPFYPQYYVPLSDVDGSSLVDEDHVQRLHRGPAHVHALVVGDERRPGAARVYGEDANEPFRSTVRFEWDSLDAWFEEDEEVFVHPRNPYVRVDALRSTRSVRVELDGVVLAESASPVMVFETGLPTRYYLDRTDLRLEHLTDSSTVTACPYKGRTSRYWNVRTATGDLADLAWSYDFPTRQLLPIAGLVAFYNENVDIFIDGELTERPVTHFFP
jgi:uncharacterized protein (DUF427 family)